MAMHISKACNGIISTRPKHFKHPLHPTSSVSDIILRRSWRINCIETVKICIIAKNSAFDSVDRNSADHQKKVRVQIRNKNAKMQQNEMKSKENLVKASVDLDLIAYEHAWQTPVKRSSFSNSWS